MWWCANFPLFFSLLFSLVCSITSTKLTPESPTRWEGSRISIAKSNSSFLVSTSPGVEEKTGNFCRSLFDGLWSGDVDLTCAVPGNPEVGGHVMKARAGRWHRTVHGFYGPSTFFSLLFHTVGQTLPRYLWRIKQCSNFSLNIAEEGVC